MLASPRPLLPLLLFATLAGCVKSPTPERRPDQPLPTTIAEAEAFKARGVRWDNGEIRAYYLRLVQTIAPDDAKRREEGRSAEERGRRAYTTRHDARMLCRAMMGDPAEVELLRRRDQEKYGQPDGPTFEQLVARNREKGLTGDEAWEAIVRSAGRTDQLTNRAYGVGDPLP